MLVTSAWVKLNLTLYRQEILFIPKRSFQLTVALCWRRFSPGWLNFCGHCHHLVAFRYWVAGAAVALLCPAAYPTITHSSQLSVPVFTNLQVKSLQVWAQLYLADFFPPVPLLGSSSACLRKENGRGKGSVPASGGLC